MTEREIGMGKLMKYVEEMQKEGINVCRPTFQEYYLLEMMLISKYYGLIKRLVENDKIDTRRIKLFNVTEYRDKQDGYIAHGVTICDSLLMLLAIQDEPIRFLCEIIK